MSRLKETLTTTDTTELKTRKLKPATKVGEGIRNFLSPILKLTQPAVRTADISIEGHENLQKLKGSGAIIVVAPHNGHPDTILVRDAFEKEFRKLLFFIAAADYWEAAVHAEDDTNLVKLKNTLVVFKRKIFSPAAVRILPIDRHSSEQAFFDLEQAAERALAGEMPVLYPEGTRSRDGKRPMSQREFKTGLGLLVLMTEGKVPIVPVYLEGNESLMPPEKNKKQLELEAETLQEETEPSPTSQKVVVHIGEPIDTSSLVQKSLEEMEHKEIRAARRMITSLTHGYFVGKYEDITGDFSGPEPY